MARTVIMITIIKITVVASLLFSDDDDEKKKEKQACNAKNKCIHDGMLIHLMRVVIMMTVIRIIMIIGSLGVLFN